MKLPVILAGTMLLASCAAPSADRPWIGLYDRENLRDEQKWPMTLPQVQQALFAHEAACGSAPNFAVDPAQPNIAYVWQEPAANQHASHTILLELARLYGDSLRVQAYAQLGVSSADIRHLYNTILNPETCN